MKYFPLDLDLEIEKDKVNTLLVEDEVLFRNLVSKLIEASNGEENTWELVSNGKFLDFKKEAFVITDFFRLDINDKTLLSKLQQRLALVANENSNLTYEVNEALQRLLNVVEDSCNLELIHKDFITSQDIIKISGFSISESQFGDVDKVIEYIDAVMDLINPKLVVLVNTNSFIAMKERTDFFVELLLKKIPLFCIEKNIEPVFIDEKYEMLYTLDEDLCVF